MKKLFEIEWDNKRGNMCGASLETALTRFFDVGGAPSANFKVTELPQPTKSQCIEIEHTIDENGMCPKCDKLQPTCECEKPIQGVWGIASKVYLCNTCGFPIKPKPKIEKLNPVSWYREDWEKILWNKLNDVIEWINQEGK